jgi:chorismate synthase
MSNSFGQKFRITTFGESHGPFIGVIIDGCPSNLEITEDEINLELEKRRPNQNEFTSQRKESDKARIVSGVFENKTTGAPICILIVNENANPSDYYDIKDILRPSHFNFTYLQKYKNFDYRGAGRASARETASRVAAGAIAKKILKKENINIYAYIKSIGGINANIKYENLKDIQKSCIFCPDKKAEIKMIEKLKQIKNDKDSIGGVVEFYIENAPAGLGEPVFDKLNAKLAYGLMSIPAAKAVEIGDGFDAAKKVGSIRNDRYSVKNNKIITKTNNEGGIIAGISNGMPIIGRVAFKPAPTIGKLQNSVDIHGNKKILKYPSTFRIDCCVAIRAAAVVESMCALVLIDSFLLNKTSNLEDSLKDDTVNGFEKMNFKLDYEKINSKS